MKRVFRHREKRKWAEIEITVENGRFSASGSYGRISGRKTAKRMARELWQDFLCESPEELGNLMKRFPGEFDSVDGAVSFMLRTDGELHGLDVHRENTNSVWLYEGCGQCLDTIAETLPNFPNIDRILDLWRKWHLNDMHAGCEHQRALGWEKDGYDKHPSEPCPECGYKFGTAWNRAELPADIEEQIAAL